MHTFKKLKIAGVLAGTAVVCGTVAAESAAERPNIILCMADDQGWGDVSYNGHPILKTPNLDELSRAGLRFDQFHAAAPVCSPTRGSVLTGRHPNRFGCFRWGYDLRPQEITIAEALKTAGYATGHFGKWHLGSVVAGSPVNPGNSGFDEWYTSPNTFDNDPILSHKGVAVPFKGESSIVTAELAVDFIREQSAAGTPFLAVVWFGSPHKPHIAAPEFKEPYKEYKKKADFYGEIAGIDGAVGLLRKELRNLNIQDNTIFWYCSDNGGLFPESSGGRGKKASIYEGGFRVPGIIEWPKVIEPGRVTQMLANTVDMYPTLLDITGIHMDNQPPLDGISLRPLINGKPMERSGPMGFWAYERPGKKLVYDDITREMLNKQEAGETFVPVPEELRMDAEKVKEILEEGDFAGRSAWLDWPWRLVRIDKEGRNPVFELYNLSSDPMESTDIIAQHAERAESMKAQMAVWMNSVIRSQNGGDYK